MADRANESTYMLGVNSEIRIPKSEIITMLLGLQMLIQMGEICPLEDLGRKEDEP